MRRMAGLREGDRRREGKEKGVSGSAVYIGSRIIFQMIV